MLAFYYNDGEHVSVSDQMFVDDKAKPLMKITNPANKKQYFDVLEVMGGIYKGVYRMRLIYSPENDCVLMGEEILQLANL